MENYRRITQPGGPALGTASDKQDALIQKDGLFFKNLAHRDELLPYEDWRLSPKERAKDLVLRMTIEEIAGLMLYSSHQSVPAVNGFRFSGTYDGKDYTEDIEPWRLTDQQKKLISDDKIRNVLAMRLKDARCAAKWNNELQKLAEETRLGIPVNISSDPRHGATFTGAEYRVGGSDTSKWPEGIAMSATFDPDLCRKFADIASREYRALGITTALSPQIDLATEPRWMRFGDTFGEHTALTIDMAKAYCDGMQTNESPLSGEEKGSDTDEGWGFNSVAAMAKHWPGGGSGEGGRDAHYFYGKYAVYPGKNFAEHLKPFTEGAFCLDGPTKRAAAVMPYYTISWGADATGKEQVGNSYSHYMIHDLLREKYGYDGIVCTDWGITHDHNPSEGLQSGKCWGVEGMSQEERHYKALMNGVDQFGGNNEAAPLLAAYEMGCKEHGEAFMRKRMEESAVRILTQMFRLGLFENPYLDSEKSADIVGCEEFCREGYLAQQKSVVLLKNGKDKPVLPLKRCKVYVPRRYVKLYRNFFGEICGDEWSDPMPEEILSRFFDVVDSPEKADAALVYIEAPESAGYREEDVENGGNGYFPINLQYRPYTAKNARKESIAGGDPTEAFTNRSYAGKTNYTFNEQDLDNVLEMRKAMGDKPVIVIDTLNKPSVMAEFEPCADAIIVNFGVQLQAILDIVTGKAAPSGLLPIQIPKDMETVEAQMEDVAFDMTPYTDSCGNTYDFGFGLDWDGVIKDERNEKYSRHNG